MTPRLSRISAPGIALAAAVGVIGYVAGLVTAPRSASTPTPSTVAALPTSTATSSSPEPTRAPVSPRATPETTEPPSWAWRRTEFEFGEGNLSEPLLHVDEIWGLGDDVIAHGAVWDTHYMLTYGGGWPTTSAPRAISGYWGGLALDGRLWFLVHDEGLRPRESSLRLAGTTAGSNPTWQVFGPSDLDRDVPIRFLGHVGDRWVAAYIGEGGSIETGVPQYLTTSSDGVHWTPARVPSLEGVDPFDVGFNAATSADRFVIVQAFADRSGRTGYFNLISRDGVRWRETKAPDNVEWNSSIACDASRCVLTRYAHEEQTVSYPMPIAWVSTDGEHWTPSETVFADASAGSGLIHVEATDEGFVGLDRETNRVWLSDPDGMTWRAYQAIPSDLPVPIIDLAVAGDTVVALEREPDLDPQGAWVGSLAALRRAD